MMNKDYTPHQCRSCDKRAVPGEVRCESCGAKFRAWLSSTAYAPSADASGVYLPRFDGVLGIDDGGDRKYRRAWRQRPLQREPRPGEELRF